MRKVFLLCILATIFGFEFVAAQTNGGPDAYGYTWRNSNDAQGPTYNWIDITTKQNAQQISVNADDAAVGPFALGFAFQYYWSTYSEVKIGTNGWISFKTSVGNIAHCFPNLPSPGGAGDNFLAPFMTDLNFHSSYASQYPNVGEMWTWSNGVDTFIVSYIDVPWWQNDNGGSNPPDWIGSNTFQVIMTNSDSSITYQYMDLDPTNFNDIQQCGTDLVVGIENVTGNIGLEVATETVFADQFAVKFYHPGTSTLQIPDLQPSWNANSDNAGQFFLTNQNISLTTNIENVGNASVPNSIQVDGELVSLSASTIYQSSSTLDSLQAGMNSIVTFSPSTSITTAGQYYYEVSVANSNDINPSNNDNSVEVSAVEKDANDRMWLTYATLNPPDGVAGFGVDDGLGIKIVPPGYPVDIDSISLFLLHDTTAAQDDFDIMIYADDSTAGNGTLLDSIRATGANSVDNDWNTYATSGFTLNSGGIYVSFIARGAGNVFIGTEAFGPISRRTYEVIGGTWATYRTGTAEDFLIQVNADASSLIINDENPIDMNETSFVNYPNPTNGLATIKYDLASATATNFSVINTNGQVVFAKEIGMQSAGTYSLDVNTADFTPGIYFIRMEADGKVSTRKMMVTR